MENRLSILWADLAQPSKSSQCINDLLTTGSLSRGNLLMLTPIYTVALRGCAPCSSFILASMANPDESSITQVDNVTKQGSSPDKAWVVTIRLTLIPILDHRYSGSYDSSGSGSRLTLSSWSSLSALVDWLRWLVPLTSQFEFAIVEDTWDRTGTAAGPRLLHQSLINFLPLLADDIVRHLFVFAFILAKFDFSFGGIASGLDCWNRFWLNQTLYFLEHHSSELLLLLEQLPRLVLGHHW